MLAEYTALRNEIAYRSTAQLAIVTFNITAVGALTSVTLTDLNHSFVLFLMPYVTWALARLFIDHARAIYGIGRYTRLELWPTLQNVSLPTKIASWEQHLKDEEKDTRDEVNPPPTRDKVAHRGGPTTWFSRANRDWMALRLRRYGYASSLCAIFMAPPIVMLVAAPLLRIPPLTTTLTWIVWLGGIGVLVTLVPSWIWFFNHTWQPDDSKPEHGPIS